MIVLSTFEMARAIILESALSFLGLGVPPNLSSWGTMLSDGREYIDTYWWLAFFPGIAIAVTVLGANTLGDGLSDALNPKMSSARRRSPERSGVPCVGPEEGSPKVRML
jgi:peptide/nickel transport system permease protein